MSGWEEFRGGHGELAGVGSDVDDSAWRESPAREPPHHLVRRERESRPGQQLPQRAWVIGKQR